MIATHVPAHIETAAAQAQKHASVAICVSNGRNTAAISDVAMALAHAYGEAIALYHASGAGHDQVEALARTSRRATQAMLSKLNVPVGLVAMQVQQEVLPAGAIDRIETACVAGLVQELT